MIGELGVGGPSASTAGTQPEPRTTATSWRSTPVRCGRARRRPRARRQRDQLERRRSCPPTLRGHDRRRANSAGVVVLRWQGMHRRDVRQDLEPFERQRCVRSRAQRPNVPVAHPVQAPARPRAGRRARRRAATRSTSGSAAVRGRVRTAPTELERVDRAGSRAAARASRAAWRRSCELAHGRWLVGERHDLAPSGWRSRDGVGSVVSLRRRALAVRAESTVYELSMSAALTAARRAGRDRCGRPRRDGADLARGPSGRAGRLVVAATAWTCSRPACPWSGWRGSGRSARPGRQQWPARGDAARRSARCASAVALRASYE